MEQLRYLCICNNCCQQSNKRFWNFCKHLGHNIETYYHRNKSNASISIAPVANTKSIQPTTPISKQSKSSGSIITISTVDLWNIITNTIHMVGNASYSSSLSIQYGMSPSSWLMDFACCNHMTSHSSLFSQLEPASHLLNICTTNGSIMFGHNIGSIRPPTFQFLGFSMFLIFLTINFL